MKKQTIPILEPTLLIRLHSLNTKLAHLRSTEQSLHALRPELLSRPGPLSVTNAQQLGALFDALDRGFAHFQRARQHLARCLASDHSDSAIHKTPTLPQGAHPVLVPMVEYRAQGGVSHV